MVPQVLRDPKGSKGQRENVEKLVPEQVAPLDQWDPRVSVARWASKVRREILVRQAHKEVVVAMVLRVTKEHQGQWVALDFVDQRAIVECKAQKVTQGSKGQKATRVMSEFAESQVQLVFLAHLVQWEHLVRGVLSDQLAVVV